MSVTENWTINSFSTSLCQLWHLAPSWRKFQCTQYEVEDQILLTIAGYDGYPLHLAQTRSRGASSLSLSKDRSVDFPVNRIFQYIQLIQFVFLTALEPKLRIYGIILVMKVGNFKFFVSKLLQFASNKHTETHFSMFWLPSHDTHQAQRCLHSHFQGL